MAGLVVFLTGSVSEAAVLRARSASFDKQADAEWGDRPVHGKGGVHAGGRPTDARASVQDLLAGIDDPGDVNPEMDGVVNLLKSTPMKDLLDVVKPEIDKMETQILDAKASAQNTLDGIDAAITTCKSNQSAGEGQASGLQTTMNGKRQPHKDCRGVENSDKIEYDSCVKTMDALKTTMDLACDAYNTAVKPPNVNLVPSPNANEEYKLWLGRVKAWVDAELSSVTQKEAACDTARSDYENEKDRCEGPSGDGGLKKAWEDKKTQCDEAQTAFETAACDYSSQVATTCSSYGTCVAATKTVYDNQRQHIEREEGDRETEFRAVQRIKCLLDVWSAQGDSVDKAKLQECVDKTHSTSHLELSYPTIPVVDACTLPERPCTPGFVTAEYGSLPAHAPHKACTPCAGAASTPVASSPGLCSRWHPDQFHCMKRTEGCTFMPVLGGSCPSGFNTNDGAYATSLTPFSLPVSVSFYCAMDSIGYVALISDKFNPTSARDGQVYGNGAYGFDTQSPTRFETWGIYCYQTSVWVDNRNKFDLITAAQPENPLFENVLTTINIETNGTVTYARDGVVMVTDAHTLSSDGVYLTAMGPIRFQE